jgi:hypothetical protein
MSDELESLRRQLAEAQENLKLIHERMHEYVMQEDIPLQLIKNERRLQQRITELEQRIAGESAQQPLPATPPQPSPAPGGDTINAPGAQGFVNRPTGEIHQYYGTVHISQGGPPPADTLRLEHVQAIWPAVVRSAIAQDDTLDLVLHDVYPVAVEGNVVVVLVSNERYRPHAEKAEHTIRLSLSRQLGYTVGVRFIVQGNAP